MEPMNLPLSAGDSGAEATAPTPTAPLTSAASPLTSAPAAAPAAAPAMALRLAAGASALAGVLHYAAVPGHRAEWWAAAVFFTALAAFEIIWAAQVWCDDRRPVLWLGVLVNAGVVALWATSRTSGLPFGPDAGVPEAIGALDVACVAAEVVTLAALVRALLPRRERPAAC